MKKLLVLTLSVVMVFSLAAVSMAAATVKGDFRYDMYENDEKADKSYAESDLRLNVSGDISESVSATGVFQMVQGPAKTTPEWKMNEYYVTYKQSWGGVKAGYYEYKFTPSRVLLKSGRKHVWDKVDVMAATTINLPVEGLSADVLFQPYAQKTMDDCAYGLSLTYAGEKFGAKVTYADFKDNYSTTAVIDETDLTAFDVYYKLNDDMKVFVLGVDWSANDVEGGEVEGLDPVLGFSWDKIAGSKVFAAIEYALNPRFDGTDAEYNEFTVNLKYKFNNAVGLEVEHYVVGDGLNKDMVRLRYQF